MNVPSLMRQATQLNCDRRALHADERTFAFGEAGNRGVRTANALTVLGVQSGDRIATVEDNGFPAADLFLGAAIASAVRVLLDARNFRDSHKGILRSTAAKVLFTDAHHYPSVAGLQDELPGLQHTLVQDEGYEGWLLAQSDADSEIRVAIEDWHVICHSSGTSRRSKGVSYTPARMGDEFAQLAYRHPHRAGPRCPDLPSGRLPVPADLDGRRHQPPASRFLTFPAFCG